MASELIAWARNRNRSCRRHGAVCHYGCRKSHDDVIKWKHFPRYWSFVPVLWESIGHRWFSSQRSVTRCFEFFFDLRLNKPLSKQSKRRWVETPSRSLWRQCYVLSLLDNMSIPQQRAILAIWWCPVHDDIIELKHFPHYWPFVRGIHWSPVNSPHKGQWRGVLMFSLICTRINGWVNNGEAGDLRRHRAHYDITVMGIHVLHYFSHTECHHRGPVSPSPTRLNSVRPYDAIWRHV